MGLGLKVISHSVIAHLVSGDSLELPHGKFSFFIPRESVYFLLLFQGAAHIVIIMTALIFATTDGVLTLLRPLS